MRAAGLPRSAIYQVPLRQNALVKGGIARSRRPTLEEVCRLLHTKSEPCRRQPNSEFRLPNQHLLRINNCTVFAHDAVVKAHHHHRCALIPEATTAGMLFGYGKKEADHRQQSIRSQSKLNQDDGHRTCGCVDCKTGQLSVRYSRLCWSSQEHSAVSCLKPHSKNYRGMSPVLR